MSMISGLEGAGAAWTAGTPPTRSLRLFRPLGLLREPAVGVPLTEIASGILLSLIARKLAGEIQHRYRQLRNSIVRGGAKEQYIVGVQVVGSLLSFTAAGWGSSEYFQVYNGGSFRVRRGTLCQYGEQAGTCLPYVK